MHMSSESLLVILFVGLAAGWLAGQIVDGTGFGLLGDVIIGIIGAFIGNWLMPRLGLYLGAGHRRARSSTPPSAPSCCCLSSGSFEAAGVGAAVGVNGWNRRWR